MLLIREQDLNINLHLDAYKGVDCPQTLPAGLSDQAVARFLPNKDLQGSAAIHGPDDQSHSLVPVDCTANDPHPPEPGK